MKIVMLDSGMGVLPFIKEILIQNKKNHYIIYLDELNFPYGNKPIREVFLCYEKLINKVDFFMSDIIFIACNTLSTLVNKNDNRIKDILSFNIKNKPKNAYFVSTLNTYKYLKMQNEKKVIALPKLANLIESNNIKEIIKLIKNTHFPSEIVLACTHYPLVKNLFIKYTKSKVYSFEDRIIKEFEDSEKLKIDFYTNKSEKYKKFFFNFDINFYPLT